MPTRTLNIIGAGRAARTLARLWRESGTFEVKQVVNRSVFSSADAVAFIGQGEATTQDQLKAADITLIGAADNVIADIADKLPLEEGAICFHLSGSQPSSVLAPLRERGVHIGSLHPVKSFANPALSISNFDGTYCGIEGDAMAVDLLSDACLQIGGKPFQIDANNKALYHTGSVMVCNYLNALLEAGMRCFEQAGIERETAMALTQPIVSGTVENIYRLGLADALTGPIVRGDDRVVNQHLIALENYSPDMADLYRQLGKLALDLAEQQGTGDNDGLDRIRADLE